MVSDSSRCQCEGAVMQAPISLTTLERTTTSSANNSTTIIIPRSTTTKLTESLVGDVLVALTVTASFTPCLTVVDKALVHHSAGAHTFSESAIRSLRAMALNPVQYFKSPTFLWMWATYAVTYSTANCFKTLSEVNNNRRKEASSGDLKTSSSIDPAALASLSFLGTTLANSGASICKDRAYSRMFGSGVTVVPRAAYGLWMMRDLTVIGSSFVLPPIVARYIDESISNTNKDPSEAPSARSLVIAQFATPLTAQLIAGPLHYLALDICNRPFRVSLADRWTLVRNGLSSVIPARMVRILPGYGIGGVLNQRGRQAWKEFSARPFTRVVSLRHHRHTQPNFH